MKIKRKYHTYLSQVGAKAIDDIRSVFMQHYEANEHNIVWKFPPNVLRSLATKHRIKTALLKRMLQLANSGEL